MRIQLSYPALLVLMTAAFTGCRRESLPPGDTIQFSVSGGVTAEMQTKADFPKPDDSSYLIAEGNHINIWADHKSASEGDTWTAVFPDRPQLATYTAEGDDFVWNYWGAELPVRWVKGHGYRFRAIFPADADVQEGTGGEKLEVNYSMHESEPKGNYDLLVAAKDFDSKPTDNVVPLAFHHACAAVQFSFSTASQDNDTYLTSFELQYLYSKGTLKYHGLHEDGVVSTDDWVVYGSRVPQVFHWEAANDSDRWPVPSAGAAFKDNWYFVIPQDLHYDDHYRTAVKFSYVAGTNPERTAILELPVVHNEADVIWKPGMVYLYSVQIQPSESVISLVVKAWEERTVAVDDVIF